jgi:hypothetical protein
MTLPIDTGALYDLIATDPDITSLLGAHILKSGATRPAISRLWPNETIEAATRQQGVEIQVERLPIGYAPEPCQTGEVVTNPSFSIRVTQWKPAAGGASNIQAVIDRLLVLLPGATANNVTIQDLTTGLAQFVVVWQCKVAGLIR